MDYSKLPRKNLIEILEQLRLVLDGIYSEKRGLSIDKAPINENPLESLIGTIPFLLTNKELFEKNQDIADFAKRLNIEIPSAEKKKREDLIGRIILAISNFDKRKIQELHSIINSLKGAGKTKTDRSNFFKDWEVMIKQIEI